MGVCVCVQIYPELSRIWRIIASVCVCACGVLHTHAYVHKYIYTKIYVCVCVRMNSALSLNWRIIASVCLWVCGVCDTHTYVSDTHTILTTYIHIRIYMRVFVRIYSARIYSTRIYSIYSALSLNWWIIARVFPTWTPASFSTNSATHCNSFQRSATRSYTWVYSRGRKMSHFIHIFPATWIDSFQHSATRSYLDDTHIHIFPATWIDLNTISSTTIDLNTISSTTKERAHSTRKESGLTLKEKNLEGNKRGNQEHTQHYLLRAHTLHHAATFCKSRQHTATHTEQPYVSKHTHAHKHVIYQIGSNFIKIGGSLDILSHTLKYVKHTRTDTHTYTHAHTNIHTHTQAQTQTQTQTQAQRQTHKLRWEYAE